MPVRRIATPAVIGYLLLAGGLGYIAVQQSDTVNKVDNSSKNQLTNRVSNVGVWCQAINENREEAIRRAAQAKPVTGLPPYGLKPLDCNLLKRETARSGSKPKDYGPHLPVVEK